MSAVTVLEWGDRRGCHLHVIVKGTPGLTTSDLEQYASLVSATVGGFAVIYDTAGAAGYLTKHLSTASTQRWPAHTHLTSFTHNWCPGWVSTREWKEKRKRKKEQGRRSS